MPNPPVIAVVEDDEAMREALSELLQVLDLSCRTFDCAEAFLSVYTPGTFDCLITDVRMPGITGLELQQRLKALGEAMPVIVLTSSATPHTRVHALEQGAFAYLAKPVDEKILIRCLMEALRSDRPAIDRS